MSALKFVRDAATGDHFSRSGTSYLPWPLAALSIAIHVPATMIGMPLLTAWTLVTLPFGLVREYTQKRAYAKRRAAHSQSHYGVPPRWYENVLRFVLEFSVVLFVLAIGASLGTALIYLWRMIP